MFDGLEQINWESLGYHVYGKHERIPEKIRNLLSPEPEIREEARSFLLGGGQDFGDIYDTTPIIIPFLAELLSHADTPDKAELLFHLSGVAEHIFYSSHSLPMMRLNIKTYEAFKAHLGVWIKLLADEDPAVRQASVAILQYMADEVEYLVPQLMEIFLKEENEDVQAALLNGLKILLHSMEWPRFSLRDQFSPFFKTIIETRTSYNILVAAARASVELAGPFHFHGENKDRLSPQVSSILSQAFLNQSDPWECEKIVMDLARLEADPLLNLLQNSTTNAEQTHIIVRGLLANAFLYSEQMNSHWEHFPNPRGRSEGIFYVRHYSVQRPFDPRDRRKRLLQTIVDTDKVWEIPTNLFSFFYGLPDSREGLRSLLKENGKY